MDGVLSCIPYVFDNRSMLYHSTSTVMRQKNPKKPIVLFFHARVNRGMKKNAPKQRHDYYLLVQANLYYQRIKIALLQSLSKL